MNNSNQELVNIAKGNIDDTVFDDSSVDRAKLQLRSFLLALAKRELGAVVKLTDVRDKVQSKYIEKIAEYMEAHDDDTAVQYLPVFMEVITNSLDRSTNIIKQVASDEKLLKLLYVDMSKNITVNNAAETDPNEEIMSPSSRSKVIEAINTMMEIIPEREEE